MPAAEEGADGGSAASEHKPGEAVLFGYASGLKRQYYAEMVSPDEKKMSVLAPWDRLPDWFTLLLGLVVLLPPLPMFVVLIGSALLWMNGLIYLSRFPSVAGPAKSLVAGAMATLRPLARALIVDARNEDLFYKMIFLLTYVPTLFAAAVYLSSRTSGLTWWAVALGYHLLRIGPRHRFFAWLHVLIHKEGHAARNLLFKGDPFGVCGWVISPFYGAVPNSYPTLHNKNHHVWHNMPGDVAANCDLDRSQGYLPFILFLPRFVGYWSSIAGVIAFVKDGAWEFARRAAVGMGYYYALTALVAWAFGWQFCVVFWVFPHFEAIIFLGGIAYIWHAFVDPRDPLNEFVNSFTIIAGHDCVWEEDFHVEHHWAAGTLHWSTYRQHWADVADLARANVATVFQETEQGELLFMVLRRDFDGLARKFVDVGGTMSYDEIRALVVSRLSARVRRLHKLGAVAASPTSPHGTVPHGVAGGAARRKGRE